MAKNFTWLPDWFRNGLLIVGGAVIGWFANQYMEYHSAYKEALGANYEQFKSATADLQPSLKQFADIARGAKPKTDLDVETLQSKLLQTVAAAEDLQRRINAGPGIIDRYRIAAVDLKHASDAVTGPLDAKPLITAVNDYLAAENDLRNVVVKQQSSFLF